MSRSVAANLATSRRTAAIPNIVVAGTYTGPMTRYDVHPKQEPDISVWMNNYDGWPARDIPFAFSGRIQILYLAA